MSPDENGHLWLSMTIVLATTLLPLQKIIHPDLSHSRPMLLRFTKSHITFAPFLWLFTSKSFPRPAAGSFLEPFIRHIALHLLLQNCESQPGCANFCH